MRELFMSDDGPTDAEKGLTPKDMGIDTAERPETRTILVEKPTNPSEGAPVPNPEQRIRELREQVISAGFMTEDGQINLGAIQQAHAEQQREEVKKAAAGGEQQEERYQGKNYTEEELEEVAKDLNPSLNARVEIKSGRAVIAVGPENSRVVLDPSLRVGENVFAGRARNLPETLDNADLERTINTVIADLEKTPANIDLGIINDWVNNITGYEGHLVGTDTAKAELRTRLISKLQARLGMALAERNAALDNNAEEFAKTLSYLDKAGALEFLTVKGHEDNELIRMGIAQLEAGDGAYYRLGNADTRKQAQDLADMTNLRIIRNQIRATNPGLAADVVEARAKLAYDLSQRILKVYGEETRYSGPRDQNNNLIETRIQDSLPQFRAINPRTGRRARVDLTIEEYWQMWAMARINWKNPDPNIGYRVKNSDFRLDEVGNPVQVPDIGGTLLLRNTFFTPERAEDQNYGRATKLRYAAESRGRSFVLYKGQRTLSAVIEDTIRSKAIENNNGKDPITGAVVSAEERQELRMGGIGGRDSHYWGSLIKAASDTAAKFWAAEPRLLYDPLINPNAAREDQSKAIAAMEKTVLKIDYTHAGWYLGAHSGEAGFRANGDLVAAVMGYLDTDEARNEFKFQKWHSNEKSAALEDLVEVGYITNVEANIIKSIKGKEITARSTALQNASEHFIMGSGKFLGNVWKYFELFEGL